VTHPILSPAAVPGAAPGAPVRVLDASAECRVAGSATGGAFDAFELTLPPGTRVPPHRHGAEEEACYVVAGRVRFEVGRRATTLGPGGCVLVPRRTRHALTVAGDVAARVLMIVSPAAGAARGFAELLVAFAAGPAGSPDLAEAAWLIARAHGVERPRGRVGAL
jgi:quercetin dioxygenase-like cupin family protein